jgi:hypothetical protein
MTYSLITSVRPHTRWILILLLGIFNVYAALQAASYFFTDFADLPLRGTLLSSCSPEVMAEILGHAKHAGGEAMRDYLFQGAKWLGTAALINFLATVITLIKLRKP